MLLKESKQAKLISFVIVAVAIVGAVYVVKNNPVASPSSIIDIQEGSIVYQGKDGIDALTILKENATVEAQTSSGLGEFVTSINGKQAGANEYWAIYVNGELSPTGASQTITNNTDIIEWKLMGF